MNKILFFIVCSFIYSQPQLYWDLGVAISTYPTPHNNAHSIDLSTYHRLEGLKKYYLNDFSGALFHFEQLNSENKELILYEYIDSYYSIGDYLNALSILNNANSLSDNILYLKSQIFIMLNNYDDAIFVLES